MGVGVGVGDGVGVGVGVGVGDGVGVGGGVGTNTMHSLSGLMSSTMASDVIVKQANRPAAAGMVR